jgi:hypothetical protein
MLPKQQWKIICKHLWYTTMYVYVTLLKCPLEADNCQEIARLLLNPKMQYGVYNTHTTSLRHTSQMSFTKHHNKLCVLMLLITSRPVSFNITFGTSRDGSVSIVTRLQAGRPRNHSSISGKGKGFPSPKRPYRLWSPPSIPLNRQLRLLLRRVKRPGRTANHSPPLVPGLIMSEVIPQIPHTPSWREQGQLHLNLNITGKNWDTSEKRLAAKWTTRVQKDWTTRPTFTPPHVMVWYTFKHRVKFTF